MLGSRGACKLVNKQKLKKNKFVMTLDVSEILYNVVHLNAKDDYRWRWKVVF